MELIIPPGLAYILAAGFMGFLTLILFLNIFSLPANWIILGFIALWKYVYPDTSQLGTLFFVIIIGLAVAGEVLELGLQVMKAKKYGSTSSGTFAGVVGAIVGAIVLAPLFFGIGAFIGALLGAWLGCFIMEKLKGRSNKESLDAAFGAMMGRFLGTVCKCGIGGAMIAVTGHYIWPKLPQPIEYVYFMLQNMIA